MYFQSVISISTVLSSQLLSGITVSYQPKESQAFYFFDYDLVQMAYFLNNIPNYFLNKITTVTVKTFGLLSNRAWIWLDFPGFKHDNACIKEVSWSHVCVAGHGWRTGDFHGDYNYEKGSKYMYDWSTRYKVCSCDVN